jgi:hypothetical protein
MTVGTVPFLIEGLTDAVKVGQGSFGVVYKAYQPAYGRMVAVKVLNAPVVDDVDRRRFERECQALGTLSTHPNIVTLHTAGVTSGDRPYLIMGYLPRGSLASRGILGWQEATDIMVRIAGALAGAHAEGILHRDIKPENILISVYGEPQLADFGVARIGDESTINPTTGTGAITGTLAHAAPEIVSGLAGTEVTDVWSLASTLAALLSGQPPFYRPGENSPLPLMQRILNDPPADLRPFGVPDQLCAVIEAALAKDSWERTPSATAFAAALQAIRPEQIAAPSASPGARPARVVGNGEELPTRFRANPPPDDPPLAADSGPNGRNGRGIALGAMAALVIALFVLVAVAAGRGHTTKSVTPPITATHHTGTLPVLTGQTVRAATSTLQGLGFQVHSGAIPPGSAEVPTAVGKVLPLDQSQLQRAGFTVTTTDQPDTRLPKGSVISQEPPPGSVAVKGSSVALVVSTAQGLLKNTPACQAWVATSWNPSGETLGAYRSYVPQAEANYQRFEQVASPDLRPNVADMVAQLKSFGAALSSNAGQSQAFQNFKVASFFQDFTAVLQTMTFACWEPAI